MQKYDQILNQQHCMIMLRKKQWQQNKLCTKPTRDLIKGTHNGKERLTKLELVLCGQITLIVYFFDFIDQ